MLRLAPDSTARLDEALTREWLVTNGIGGYASSTVLGMPTRRYHGLLVASDQLASDRRVMVAQCDELITCAGRAYQISSMEYQDGTIAPTGYIHILEFRLEHGLPTTVYQIGDATLEKRIWMVQGQNTTCVRYTFLGPAVTPAVLILRPLVNDRPFHTLLTGQPELRQRIETTQHGLSVVTAHGSLPIHMCLPGGHVELKSDWYWRVQYRRERERELDYLEDLFTPGSLSVTLQPGASATLLLSTAENLGDIDGPAYAWDTERQRRAAIERMTEPREDDNFGARLALAADAFVVTTDARAGGDWSNAEMSSTESQISGIVAGYHWFSRGGRDALIAAPGLLISTGRLIEARRLLVRLADDRWDGLIPARYDERDGQPDYASADTALWFFVALRAYLKASNDTTVLTQLWAALNAIIDCYLAGTHFGIAVDSHDGLVRAASDGLQLTWMDAKVGDWVVTPRQGKPVEINALWYNALRQMGEWAALLEPDRVADYRRLAEQVEGSFTQRYWYFAGGYLYDVIDTDNGSDASCRPNQLLAVGLPFPVLEKSRWRPVVDAVTDHLLTPYGLRTLSPADKQYVGWYAGNAVHRDRAYHQGTVWPWLLGPYFDACQRVYNADDLLYPQLEALRRHLDRGGLGTLSEIFDGDAPHSPQGSIADAAAVGEVLRVWLAINNSDRIKSG